MTQQPMTQHRIKSIVRLMAAVLFLTVVALAQNVQPARAGDPDVTPPVANPVVDPDPNADGWHNGDVTVFFNWIDLGTPSTGLHPFSCEHDVTISGTEGIDIEASATCQDNSGNVGDETVLLNVDLTAPETQHTGTVITAEPTRDATISFTSTDALSGVVSYLCTFGFDGGTPVETPCTSPFTQTDLADGSYVFTVAATDLAGNTDGTPAVSAFDVNDEQLLPHIDSNNTTLCEGDTITIGGPETGKYRLRVGTSLKGKDIANDVVTPGIYTVGALPPDVTIYTSLRHRVTGGAWVYHDFQKFAPCPATATPIFIASPGDRTPLCAYETVSISGPDSGKYRLRLGTSKRGTDIANATITLASGYASEILPPDLTIYATLYHRPDGGFWTEHDDIRFTPCPATATPVFIATPGENSVLCPGDNITVSGPETGSYRLRLGTTPDGLDIANATVTTTQGYAIDEFLDNFVIYATLRHRPAGSPWTIHHQVVFFGCVPA